MFYSIIPLLVSEIIRRMQDAGRISTGLNIAMHYEELITRGPFEFL
jgi:hypothetical protein